ncbi:MAG: endonuclease [Bacteroidales bacterium]|nr:endonuclease [Bacteroidales bacterium]
MIAALGALVVMFWNVENYFDPFDDPLKNDDEFTAMGERRWTWSRFESKRDRIAQTIVAAGDVWGELPALVGLAEVENRMVVSQLVRKTMLDELGYGYVHRESPDERGIDVALLYRKDVFRIVAVDSLRIPGTKTRDILYVALRERAGLVERQVLSRPDSAGLEKVLPRVGEELLLHVFVVHLPSKRGGAKASDSRREAALGVLQGAVDSLLREDPGRRIVVMGDFNDTDPAVTGLVQPPFDGDPARPGTLRYHGRWERIDHFFLSPAAPGAMQIFAPGFLLERDEAWLGDKPRRAYVGPRYHGGLSDHLPILLKMP